MLINVGYKTFPVELYTNFSGCTNETTAIQLQCNQKSAKNMNWYFTPLLTITCCKSALNHQFACFHFAESCFILEDCRPFSEHRMWQGGYKCLYSFVPVSSQGSWSGKNTKTCTKPLDNKWWIGNKCYSSYYFSSDLVGFIVAYFVVCFILLIILNFQIKNRTVYLFLPLTHSIHAWISRDRNHAANKQSYMRCVLVWDSGKSLWQVRWQLPPSCVFVSVWSSTPVAADSLY